MAAPRIVPAFDEIEDGEPRLDLRAEPVPIEEFALERREEALTQRVVVRVADAAHRGRTPASAHRLPKATDVYWQPWSE